MARFVVFILLSAAFAASQEFDILIHDGRIADGSGNPVVHGDLGIKDGRIAAMGKLAGRRAVRSIDAKGLVVARLHRYAQPFRRPCSRTATPGMVRMGVTSMILGEGSSSAPTPKFPRFRDYWSALLKGGVSTNIGSYVGSGLIFETAHGSKPGPATAGEIEKMRELIRQAMEDGAFGVSTSLHQTPGFWISTEELVEMAKVAGAYGGIYSSHIRTEGEEVFEAVSEAIQVGKRAGVPVDILHLKIAHHKLWDRCRS
jgi:N-acyl-D-aspartate/D-glutamate deacylase